MLVKEVVHNCLNYPEIKPISRTHPTGNRIPLTRKWRFIGQSFKQLEKQNIEFIRGFAIL